MFADILASTVSEAIHQLIRMARKLMQIREFGELELSPEITGSGSMENIEHKVIGQPKRATRAFCNPSLNRVLIYFESEWLTKYVRDELGASYDCYTLEESKEFGAVKSLGNDVLAINAEIASSVETGYCYTIE